MEFWLPRAGCWQRSPMRCKKRQRKRMGYHVAEACVLTDSNHPASIYSRIHSSYEKGFTSVNHITFEAIDRSVKLLKNATFVMDRGYDDNKIFQKLWDLDQDFVIRLTQKRKLVSINSGPNDQKSRRKCAAKIRSGCGQIH